MDSQRIVIGMMCIMEVSNSTIMSQLYAINDCYYSTSHVLASDRLRYVHYLQFSYTS